VPALPLTSGFPACAWADMFGFNGDHPGFQIGLRKNSSRAGFLLTCIAPSTIITGMGQKKPNPHAQALGSLGGKARAKNLSDAQISKIASKGGKARAAKLSAAELSRIAKLAVAARERKRKGKAQ